jgi:hypothetical protein
MIYRRKTSKRKHFKRKSNRKSSKKSYRKRHIGGAFDTFNSKSIKRSVPKKRHSDIRRSIPIKKIEYRTIEKFNRTSNFTK